MGLKVQQFANKFSILCLQEVHGEEAEIMLFLSRILPGWKCFISASRSIDDLDCPGAGGVVSAISPRLCSQVNRFELFNLYSGRCISVSMWIENSKINIINIHNFEIPKQHVLGIGRHLSMLLEESFLRAGL